MNFLLKLILRFARKKWMKASYNFSEIKSIETQKANKKWHKLKNYDKNEELDLVLLKPFRKVLMAERRYKYWLQKYQKGGKI